MKRKHIVTTPFKERQSKHKKLDTCSHSLLDNNDILFSIFRYLKGKDLNRARFVSSQWHSVIFSDYFMKEHCKDLKVPHNIKVETRSKRQVKTVQYVLGLKQGKELTYSLVPSDRALVNAVDNTGDGSSSSDPNVTMMRGYLISELWFKNGKKHGKMTHYYKNGKVSHEEQFENGEKHGKFVSYFKKYPDSIESQCFYQANKLHGQLIEYKILNISDSPAPVKKQVSKQNSDASTNEGVIDGKFKVIITQQCEYKAGKLNGTKIEYRQTLENRIWKKYQYANGKFHGVEEIYDIFGSKESEVSYVEGKRHGTSIEYFKGGVYPCRTRVFDHSKVVEDIVHSRPSRVVENNTSDS